MIVSFGQLLVATALMAVLLVAAHAAGLAVLPAAVPADAHLPEAGVRGLRAWCANGSATCSAPSRSRSSAPPPSGPTRIEERTGAAHRRRHRAAPVGRDPGAGAGRADLLHRRGGRRPGQRRRGRGRRHARHRRASSPSASCWRSCSWCTLFVGPVQIGTEVLNEAQNAIAGWRRVLGVLDTPADVADPGDAGRDAAARADRRALRARLVRLPGRPDRAGRRRPRARAAVPGRRRGRDRVGQDDVRQAADPADGPGRAAGSWSTGWTCASCPFASLRARIVMVPQDGFLFEGSIADNVRFGRPVGHRRGRRARADRARPARLARRPAARPRHRRRAARRAALGRRAPARRAGPRLPGRPGPARARRGDLARSTRPPRCGSPAPSRG